MKKKTLETKTMHPLENHSNTYIYGYGHTNSRFHTFYFVCIHMLECRVVDMYLVHICI